MHLALVVWDLVPAVWRAKAEVPYRRAVCCPRATEQELLHHSHSAARDSARSVYMPRRPFKRRYRQARAPVACLYGRRDPPATVQHSVNGAFL